MKPLIVTSSWFQPLSTEFARIGISRGVPRGQSGYRYYRIFTPGPWFMSCGSVAEFNDRYNDEILAPLDPERVLADLLELAGGKIPAMLCWEPPEPGPKCCHRGLVSVWFYETLGLEVLEFGRELDGFGWAHPKLHPSVRRATASQSPFDFASRGGASRWSE